MNDLKELIIKTEKIKEKGWIKSEIKGTAASGKTFEKALGIEKNNFEIPDYGEIEIKTKTNSKFYTYITLFSATPNSYLYEIKRIHELYSYPYYKDKDLNVFNMSIYSNKKVYGGNNHYFKLHVDYKKEQIVLHVFNNEGKIIDNNCAWSFSMIEEKVNRKLKYLLFVKAERKFEHNEVFFRYTKHQLYILKDFKTFIKAIEEGCIRVSFRINVFKDGYRYGQIHDHGTSFDIEEKNLEKIYYKLN